ncbi:MAG: hypothetical protein LBL52_03645 [Rickettsiales bacterium]|jgi:hypothetical protein|nr:hypothetical protein [Rickettsiales bacterium]
MNFTDIDLASRALNLIGAREISSLDEGSAEAQAAAGIYPLVKRRLISSFTWSFARKSERLNRLDGEGACGYIARFALPPDFIRAVGISPRVEYKIAGGELVCNASAVELDYIADVGAEGFSPMFVSALVSALAAEFSLCLLDDGTKFNTLQRRAMLELKEARLCESQQESPKRIASFPLSNARK